MLALVKQAVEIFLIPARILLMAAVSAAALGAVTPAAMMIGAIHF